MPILEGTEQAVNNSNFKVLGEAGAQQVLLMREEAVTNWAEGNKLGRSITAKASELLLTTDPLEGRAARDLFTGHSGQQDALAQIIVPILAQVLSKVAGNTPPVTP